MSNTERGSAVTETDLLVLIGTQQVKMMLLTRHVEELERQLRITKAAPKEPEASKTGC